MQDWRKKKRGWMQDDSFAFEKLTLLTKLSNYLLKNTNALLTATVTPHIYHSSLLQGDSKSLYFSSQGLWNRKISLTKKESFEKNTQTLSRIIICLSLCFHFLFYLILCVSWTHINLNFTFLYLGLHTDSNL